LNSVRISTEHFKKLQQYLLSKKVESAAFLLAGFFENDTGMNLVVRDVLIPDDVDYDDRTQYHLEVSAKFFNKAISRAERNQTTIIQCHSHPFSIRDLRYSASDNIGESTSSKTIFDCLEKKPMGSLLFGKDRIVGRIWIPKMQNPIQIDQIRIVGRNLEIRNIGEKKEKTHFDPNVFDRQIRAFGLKGQELLSNFQIGIIGLGGTGSSIAEQLVREGVTKFILIDHDKFEPSNKTRLYGSYAKTKSHYKVDIIEKNIKKIQSKAAVEKIQYDVISQKALTRLKNCDVIFACTDNHASRSVINELAYQYFIPVIDMGVGLDAKNDKILGGTVRATLIGPSLPCMYCSGIINSEQILAESLNDEDRAIRVKEGYIRGLQNDAPSVITFTTMAATFGLLLFKDLIFKFLHTHATTLTLDVTTFKTSKLIASIQSNCVCNVRVGKGDYMPLSAP